MTSKVPHQAVFTAILIASATVCHDDAVTNTTLTTPDSVGHVVVGSFMSTALGITKNYVVYLPPSYSTSGTRKYPVTYFLHGFMGNEHTWVDTLNLDKALDSIATAGDPEMIVVMPDGDDSFYHTWVNPPAYSTCLARGMIGREPATTYCVPNMRYDDYIANDLVAHIDSTYRTLSDSHHRGIAGYSMGGAGAIYLTLTRPNTFGAAASLSGGLLALLNVGPVANPVTATDTAQLHAYYTFEWIDFTLLNQYGADLNTWRTYDPLSIAASLPAASIAPIWLIVGRYDAPSLPGNQLLHNLLTARGVNHVYLEPQGEHTADFWRTYAGEAAAWLAGQVR